MGSEADRVKLNVAGKVLVVERSTLRRYQHTKLGRLATCPDEFQCDKDTGEFYFDRNPKMLQAILDLYRTGQLHFPSNICSQAAQEELKFWEVPETLLSKCCWIEYSKHRQQCDNIDEVVSYMTTCSTMDNDKRTSSAGRLWRALEDPTSSTLALAWSILDVLIVILSLIAVVLRGDVRLRQLQPGFASTLNASELAQVTMKISMGMTNDVLLITMPLRVLQIFDIFCTFYFLIIFLLRLCCCPSKREFFKRPLTILDILTLIVLLLVSIMEIVDFANISVLKEAILDETTVQALLVFHALTPLRVTRIFHIARRMMFMRGFLLMIRTSLCDLGLLLLVTVTTILFMGVISFYTEILCDTNGFPSIPAALWWAVVTMTTVGYGDFYPKSEWGWLVGSVCALSGVLLLSMPIAIIANNFSVIHSAMIAWRKRAKAVEKAREEQQSGEAEEGEAKGDENRCRKNEKKSRLAQVEPLQ